MTRPETTFNKTTVSEDMRGCKGRILLVDDEQIIIDLWSEILRVQQYHVDWRKTNFEAFRAFQAAPDFYDLVITELSTINIRGLVLNELLKKNRPDLPVIILAGFSYPHAEAEAKAVGVRHFLYKPIKAKELCKIIEQTIEGGARVENAH